MEFPSSDEEEFKVLDYSENKTNNYDKIINENNVKSNGKKQ